MEGFHKDEFEKLSHGVQRQTICEHLSWFSVGVVLEDHTMSKYAERADKEPEFDKRLLFDLAQFSTWSDGNTGAEALTIGPIRFEVDEVSSVVTLEARYFKASNLPEYTMDEPLKLTVETFSVFGPIDLDSAEGPRKMTESRPATKQDYHGIIRLLSIAQKRAQRPDLYPLDQDFLLRINEEHLPYLSTMYPKTGDESTDRINSEIFEHELEGYFAADKAGTPGEIIFKIHSTDGKELLIKISKEENDYEIRVFDPETEELTKYAVGPFSDNKGADKDIKNPNITTLNELNMLLKKGAIVGGTERILTNRAIKSKEQELIDKIDERLDEEHDVDFPGLI